MRFLGIQSEGYSFVNFIAFPDYCDKEKQAFYVIKPTVTLIWIIEN